MAFSYSENGTPGRSIPYNGKSSQNHLQTDRIGEIVLLTFRRVLWLLCVWNTLTLLEFIHFFSSSFSLSLHFQQSEYVCEMVNGIFRIPNISSSQQLSSVVVGRSKEEWDGEKKYCMYGQATICFLEYHQYFIGSFVWVCLCVCSCIFVLNEAYPPHFGAHIQVALTSVQISRCHGMPKNVCYLPCEQNKNKEWKEWLEKAKKRERKKIKSNGKDRTSSKSTEVFTIRT